MTAFRSAVFAWLAAAAVGAAVETDGPVQLLERGRAAFAANDLATAEEALEKFVIDYGEAAEAKEAARIHRPLVAICKVGLKKFGEALPWIEESLQEPGGDAAVADELRFWRGICLMATGELVAAQRAFGEYWSDESHNAFKRYEALLLFAALYVQQDFPAEAADFLEAQLPMVRQASPEAAGRAAVLELHARIEAGQTDEALAVVRREQEHLGSMTQVIAFQTLVLGLGAACLDEGRHHDAIGCLQRVWPQRKLVDYQNRKVAQIQERIESLKTRPNAQATVFQLRAILGRVEREVESFSAIEHFDSALRFRLASAFQGLGRFREAALVLEEMLGSLPPDPVVEQAALAQIQCWMECRHWQRAVSAAERYEEVFGVDGPSLPTVLFLKAEALRESQDHGAAQLAYGALVDRFSDDPFAAKAMFMQGFLYLLQDDNDGALYQFDQVLRRHAKSEVADDADYWTGMAHSFAGLYAEAREHLVGYLERYGSPRYRKEAIFRIAACTFSLAEYVEAIDRLDAFGREHPGDPLTDEANLLLGDACFGEGRNDEGFAAYGRVRPESVRLFEEAWFRKGNALKLLEEIPAMRAHFEQFVIEHPDSGRLPEAVYWIGWTHQREGNPGKARDIYWRTIEDYGDDPDRYTVVDLFAALPQVYRHEGASGKTDLLTKLKLLGSTASIAGKTTLALRAGWAEAMNREGDEARTELLSLARLIDPRRHEPSISVAVAEAQLASGNPLTAKALLAEIRKWHPRCLERGRIYRALGDIAAADGDAERAIGYYERFGREPALPEAVGEVRLKMAGLRDAAGQHEEARQILAETLEIPRMAALIKAEALLRLGESHAGHDEHAKAIVYFERVYVAYGKFAELNAKAYWRRGQSLEKLRLGREALETYEELIARSDLGTFPEAELAGRRVAALRREFPEDGKEGAL